MAKYGNSDRKARYVRANKGKIASKTQRGSRKPKGRSKKRY